MRKRVKNQIYNSVCGAVQLSNQTQQTTAQTSQLLIIHQYGIQLTPLVRLLFPQAVHIPGPTIGPR